MKSLLTGAIALGLATMGWAATPPQPKETPQQTTKTQKHTTKKNHTKRHSKRQTKPEVSSTGK